MIIKDIWRSQLALPLWVSIWIWLVLVPVNFLPLLLIGRHGGWLIAVLAASGVLVNAWFILANRGFSNIMALSHLVFWPPMIVLIVVEWSQGGLTPLLWVLLVVDGVSLCFDIRDGWLWFKGDRAVAGR